MIDLSNHIIYESATVKEAIVKLNLAPKNLTLFILNESEQLVGALTDGDIRRGLVSELTLESHVSSFMNKNFLALKKGAFSLDEVDKLIEQQIKLVPLIDDGRRIIKLFDLVSHKSILPLDAVIMAGGKGERLKPLTNDTPKPLLKVGDKPIIVHSIERLKRFGINNFIISVGHQKEKIKDYLGDGSNWDINITYLEEDKPLGTIGALNQLQQSDNSDLIVLNADILTTVDVKDYYKSYKEQQGDICVATIPYTVKIPYGVLELDGSSVKAFKEKPTYTYQSNAGIYMLNRSLLSNIPNDIRYNATDLMQDVMDSGGVVSHYAILDYWLDIGKHEDYQKAQEDIKHLKL